MGPGMDHHLIIREENGDRTFPLPEGKTHLGRASSNEIKLREKSVSRSHCLIERDGDRVLIFDNRTGNPTQIQRHGKQRSKKANGRILRDQDVLFVGRLEIVYRGCSGPRAATSSQQGDASPIPGAVPVDSPQAPMPAADPGIQQTAPWQQPAAEQPYPQQPVEPYQGQPQQQPYPAQQGQPPQQPYPAQQEQPPQQPYPAQQGQPPQQPYPAQQGQPPQQPYPAQQGQPPQQPYPAQQGQPPQQQPYPAQQPPQNYPAPGQQPVTFNPAPTEPAPAKAQKKIKRRKRKMVAPKPKTTSPTLAVTAKSGGNPGVNLAIGAGILILLLIVISVISKRMTNESAQIVQRQRSAAEKRLTEREAALKGRLNNTNVQIAKLQQMLAALEQAKQTTPSPSGENRETPGRPETPEELASAAPSDAPVTPNPGNGNIAETRELIASLIKERDNLQNQYGGLTGGTDTSKIEASIARRTVVMNENGNRILNVEDDEDSRATAVAKIPQKVELSKKDYAALIERLKETVGNYGLPVASPADLDPDLTELLRATGKDGARGLVEVYAYSSTLHSKMEKTTSFLKRRIKALTDNAYKINKDKYKGDGGYYGGRHNHYLEQLQRLLELSEKKIEIKKSQKGRLAAFQDALGSGFERLTSAESTKHLTSVYSKSKDTDLQRKMVGAFSKGNTLQAVPALIKSLSSPDQELKGLVKSALTSITGVNLGDNKKIWDAWWKENSDSETN
jgi:hypothetical protein